ncbi:MAG: PaaI family thioesterase [bacterium]|nr:PaaI family thioesterase [Gammaproteobacteria bacterium]
MKTETTTNRQDLQAYMDASPFIHASGMIVTDADPVKEILIISMPLKPEFERGAGTGQFHGGPIAALIDTAGCFAMIMVLGHGVPTVNFRTDYLRPAIKTSLQATATIRRVGRTVGVVDVDVINDDGKLIAVGRGTFGSSAG